MINRFQNLLSTATGYRPSNKRVGRKSAASEPYFAVLDPNLVRRSKWSVPQQRTADALPGDPRYYQQFGGAGAVAAIVVGRCRLTPGTPWFRQMTPRLLSVLETKM